LKEQFFVVTLDVLHVTINAASVTLDVLHVTINAASVTINAALVIPDVPLVMLDLLQQV
jgi:hypothetical protein